MAKGTRRSSAREPARDRPSGGGEVDLFPATRRGLVRAAHDDRPLQRPPPLADRVGVDQAGKVLYAADLNEQACDAIQDQIAAGLKSGMVSQPGDRRPIDFIWRFEGIEEEAPPVPTARCGIPHDP